jgi:dTDP-4-dehydrorhamnose 3,5-epimerase
MKIIETALPGVLVLEPRRFSDQRGFFSELFRADRCRSVLNSQEFVQDNLSCSRRNVVRGLHLQNPEAQGKLVTAITGRIRDVAVDVRQGSPTFGVHVAVEISEDNGRQLWIPRGFAHGFSVLSDFAHVFYKCDAYYDPAAELTINWSDPEIGIDWGVEQPELSARDAAAPRLSETKRLPHYKAVG